MPSPPPPRFEVCADPAAASALAAAGVDVVVVLAPGRAITVRPVGPGRIAVLVGDPDDAADRRAASAMGAELFGA